MLATTNILLTLVLALFGEGLSPLTPEERTALNSAIDGRDHKESAFAALADALLRSDPATIDRELLNSWSDAQIAAALERPDDVRGEAVYLHGRLEQATPLDRPWIALQEWFIRDASGQPIAVFVAAEDPGDEGKEVFLAARFYKWIEAEARDGTLRRYPAFVGRAISQPAASGSSGLALAGLGLVVMVMLGLFAVARRLAVRGARHDRARWGLKLHDNIEVEDEVDLPSDPAEALDVLAARSHAADDKGDDDQRRSP